MRKGGSNWVEGEKFFDRTKELEALEERVREGNHTLLTAQRRMGKTSLVRELQRRLKETENFHVVFVDLEGPRIRQMRLLKSRFRRSLCVVLGIGAKAASPI